MMVSANLERARKYCVYQERCHFEVRSKLLEWKIYGEELEENMADLITENFLNEERYAKAYVSGKFKINQWGRKKIVQGLKAKQISNYSIQKGMEGIDETDYDSMVGALIEKRKREKSGHTDAQIIQYMLSRGFEYEYIQKKLKHES